METNRLNLPRNSKAPVLLAQSRQFARLRFHGGKVHMLCSNRADKAYTFQLLKDLELLRIILSRIGLNNSMLFPIGTVGGLKRRIQGQLSTGRIKQRWQLPQDIIRNLRNDFP